MKTYYGSLETSSIIKYKGYTIERAVYSVELFCKDGCIGNFQSVSAAKKFVDDEIRSNNEDYNNAVMKECYETPLYQA